MTGTSSFLPWFAPWILDYAMLHSAVIICPDYRLLPEATGLDSLSDMDDLFDWIESDLQQFLSKVSPNVEVNTSKLLAYGDSAGTSRQSQIKSQFVCSYAVLSRWWKETKNI